ncbi:MAG TPA: alpha/beta family hydrolase [Actinomycetota bacterium]|nr:alpha/beta family hydrolase [Actinomycetota bacterium]
MAATGDVVLEFGSVELAGDLAVPSGAEAIVLFAHGSGSSRRSSRNRAVAATLQDAGLATLLFDLLSDEEEAIDARTAEWRFDISLLADRLLGATRWMGAQDGLSDLRIGYFGASTGAAAALVAASEDHRVGAVVSRGGRPDLARDALALVTAPTLLIVGGADTSVIAMNEEAMGQLRCEKRMEIVPGASHLFEEPGALERVSEQARDWFADKLSF